MVKDNDTRPVSIVILEIVIIINDRSRTRPKRYYFGSSYDYVYDDRPK